MSFSRFLIPALALISVIGSSCSKPQNDPPDTLNLHLMQKIKGLDPIHSDDLYSFTTIEYAYEGLLKYHYLKRPYTLVPSLAASMPKVSEDGKTLTFKLKDKQEERAYFQDDPCFKSTNGKGREVVAEDFIYSFKRLADPKNASEAWWMFDGKIVGLNEWREEASKSGKADYSKNIEGLRAVNASTLEIKLKARSEQFLYFLAMPGSFVVAKEAVEFYGADFVRTPVGTGPYVLDRKASDINSKMIWNKNPTYHPVFYPTEGEAGDRELGLLEDAGKRLPFAPRVNLTIIQETQPQWLNFLAGSIDRVEIPKDNIEQVVSHDGKISEDMAKRSIRLQRVPRLEVVHETFNLYNTVFAKNKLLRQAISMAIDSQKMVDLFYGGQAKPAQGPIPPGIEGYDPSFKNPYRVYNPEKAKAYLAKAGYPGGKGLPPIEYATVSRTIDRQMAEYLQKELAAIGIELKPNYYTWPEFQKVMKLRKVPMWSLSWGADYPDAENFMGLFYSKNETPGPNDSTFKDPEFDRMYEKSLTMRNTPERTALYKKMAAHLVEEAPWVWRVQRMMLITTHPWLKNDKHNEVDNSFAMYLRVDPEIKKKFQK